MTEPSSTRDLPRTTLAILFLLALIGGAAWVLLPFLAALVWAAMVVIATWPLLLGVQARLGGRRGPAVAVLTVALLSLLVAPIWLGLSTIAANVDRLAGLARSVAQEGLPPPPAWVGALPVFGEHLAEAWAEEANDPEQLGARVAPHLAEAVRWVAAKAGGVGSAVVQLILTVVISAILYGSGETAADGVRRFFRRLAGERGESVAILAAKAVRAVALGIVVTALAQTFLAGVGLFLAQVPHAKVLTTVAFVLCIAQVGPMLVMAPAAIWLFSQGSPWRGGLLLAFAVIAGVLDNVLRPVLIRRGADLPLLLIMAGVIGGLIGFGIVGLFVGPVLMALLVSIWREWQREVADDDVRGGNSPVGPD